MAENRRLFFALTLPSEVQQQIIHWRAARFPADAGRPVAAANLHLTLAFLGDVSDEKRQALCRLAGRINQPGFTLRLDDAGQWLRSSVVWLGPRQAPRGLAATGQYAPRPGCSQRLLSVSAAVSSPRDTLSQCHTFRGDPRPGL